ncbi:MAG TPA: mobilome CxxCx(11)CxxC protein [Verrucomicrobiae bacterium]|nr:mobilome CxxCx(11)CxxC protein [Verrucomicrobiae bacterium]
MPIPTAKIADCTKSAIFCFGTAYIFEQRARSVRWRTNWLTFLGIANPIAVGATVGAFSADSKITVVMMTLSAGLSVPLAVLSVWSLVAKWSDNLSYFLETKTDNYRLASQYRQISQNPSLAEAEFEKQYSILETQGQIRKAQDERYDISDKEKRKGMRAGLCEYQFPCAGCDTIPKSMESTFCPVCGQF